MKEKCLILDIAKEAIVPDWLYRDIIQAFERQYGPDCVDDMEGEVDFFVAITNDKDKFKRFYEGSPDFRRWLEKDKA